MDEEACRCTVPSEVQALVETHGIGDACCRTVPLSDETAGCRVQDSFTVPLSETCRDTNEDDNEE